MRAELRCRVCERTQPLAPIAACPDCDGPLDVGYGLETVVPRRERRSMWRYEDLLPHAPVDAGSPGMTPLVPAPRLSSGSPAFAPHTRQISPVEKLEHETETLL